MSEDQATPLEQARHLVDCGSPQEAVRALRSVVADPGLHLDQFRLGVLISVLAGLGRLTSLDELENRARSATELRPQALYDLGYELVHVGLPEVAVPVLKRATLDVPNEPVVLTELAVALERSGRHGEVVATLLEAPALLGDFWLRYLLVLNALCTGDLRTARTHFPLLNGADSDQRQAVARLTRILARVDALSRADPEAPSELREWQYALNGYVLLHLSRYGFDEGMNGRYAFTQDSVTALKRDLLRAKAALACFGRTPSSVVSLPDRSSQIVASALATMLGLPWTVGPTDQNAVVVAYDLADSRHDQLEQWANADSPMLFSRLVRWREPPSVVPSVVGFLAQTTTPPWEKGLRVGADGTMEERPASNESVQVWATRIIEASDDTDEPVPSDTPEVLERFCRSFRPEPSDLFLEGPIRSSFFS